MVTAVLCATICGLAGSAGALGTLGVVGGALGGAAIGGVLGGQAEDVADASTEAAETQAAGGQVAIEEAKAAAERAQGFFDPFAGAAERGVEASQFLANPQAQFDFLKGNPLFDLALENANRQTKNIAAATGRIGAGDTLQRLTENLFLQAAPLIDRQRQDVTNLLGFGADIATAQANIETGQAAQVTPLITDIAASRAAGVVGAANAGAQGTQNLLSSAILAGSVFNRKEA